MQRPFLAAAGCRFTLAVAFLSSDLLVLSACDQLAAPEQVRTPATRAASDKTLGAKSVTESKALPEALSQLAAISCKSKRNAYSCTVPGFDISGEDSACLQGSASFGAVSIEGEVALTRRFPSNQNDVSAFVRSGQLVCVQFMADSTSGGEGWAYVTAVPETLIADCKDVAKCRNDAPRVRWGAHSPEKPCATTRNRRYAFCAAGWLPRAAIDEFSMGFNGELAEPPRTRPTKPAPQQARPGSSSLCNAGERVLFSCRVKNGKAVALCASSDVASGSGHLYYAFGRPDHVELLFPDRSSPPHGRFQHTPLTFSGGTGGYAYSFDNNGSTYIIYAVSGSERLERQGIMVTNGGGMNILADLPCSSGSVIETDDSDLRRLVRSWPQQKTLASHGLPSR